MSQLICNTSRIVSTRLRDSRSRLFAAPCFSLIFACSLFFSSFPGCEKYNQGVIESSTPPPQLLGLSVSPSSINTDSVNVGPSRDPGDILPLSVAISATISSSTDTPVNRLHYTLVRPDSGLTMASGDLLTSGASPEKSSQTVFTGKVSFKISRVTVGTFLLEIVAVADNGFQSTTSIVPLTIYRGNHPPELSNLQAPDTVKLDNESQLLTLHIQAFDADGTSDVSRVIFNSFKPDGTPSGGNPFSMFDDGLLSHGDPSAGDGVFSLTITLPPTTSTGTYTFKFQAFDRSGEGSSVLIHTVTVRQ